MLEPLPDGADAFGSKKLGLKPERRPLVRSGWIPLKRSGSLVGSFLSISDVLIPFLCFECLESKLDLGGFGSLFIYRIDVVVLR
jgi:hypothetical protein